MERLHGRKLEGDEYRGDIYDSDVDEDLNHVHSFETLLDLYIFSDKYDVPQLRRDVLDTLVNFSWDYPWICPPDVVERAYENLPSKSPLLRALVDMHVCWWDGELTEGHVDLPASFLLEMTRTFCVNRRRTHEGIEVPRFLSPHRRLCDYHEHGPD